jgi:acyl-CoA synthetase (AMP-forming)/AMP-acid ligase II/alkylation response protein AidB-like acyl-CoA dehydrogenase
MAMQSKGLDWIGLDKTTMAEHATPTHSTLVENLRQHQACTPKNIALTLMGNHRATQLTYGELANRVHQASNWLLAQNIEPHQNVVFLIENEQLFIQLFLACQQLNITPILLSLETATRDTSYLSKINETLNTSCCLTDQPSIQPHHRSIKISTAILATYSQHADARITPDPQGTCCIQYSSGSTGAPKGIRITHSNLTANLNAALEIYGHHAIKIGCGWTPLHHDMGLIGSLLLPLYVGGHAVRITPQRFIHDPLLWLKMIDKYKASFTFAPNFAYKLCAEKIKDQPLPQLDLTSLLLAVNAGEAVDNATCVEFYNAFKKHGLNQHSVTPSYGLTESTMMTTGSKYNAPLLLLDHNHRTLASCGTAAKNHSVIISKLDSLQLLPTLQEGEILVSGPSVSASTIKIISTCSQAPHKDNAEHFEQLQHKYMRTGDLGILDEYGNLYITGRIKNIIIQNGVNHHACDIEKSVTALSNIIVQDKCLVTQDGSSTILCAEIYEGATRLKKLTSDIIVWLQKNTLVQIDRILLLKHGAMPKTDIGKLKRNINDKQITKHILFDTKHTDYIEHKIPQIARQDNTMQYKLNSLLKIKLIGSTLPITKNGLNLERYEFCRYLRKIAYNNTSLTASVIICNTLGHKLLIQEPVLHSLTNKITSFSQTEINSGSDISSIGTTATKIDNEWEINGIKTWGGNNWADQVIVIAKIENNIAAFLVPFGTAGVSRSDQYTLLGLKNLEAAGITFNNARIPQENKLQKFSYSALKDALSESRLYISYFSSVLLEKAMVISKETLSKRLIKGQPFSNLKAYTEHVDHSENVTGCVDLACEKLSTLLDNNVRIPHELFIAIKVFSTNQAKHSIDKFVDFAGYNGYLLENELLKIYNDARALPIIEGANDALIDALSLSLNVNIKHIQDFINNHQTTSKNTDVHAELENLLKNDIPRALMAIIISLDTNDQDHRTQTYIDWLETKHTDSKQLYCQTNNNRPEQFAEQDHIELWLKAWLKKHLCQGNSTPSTSDNFFALGMDSISASNLTADLSLYIGQNICIDTVWENPSINQICASGYLGKNRDIAG